MVKHYGCPCGHSAQVLEGQLAPACCQCGGPMSFLRMSGAPKAKSPMVQFDAALKAQQQADVNGCLPGHPFYGITREPKKTVAEQMSPLKGGEFTAAMKAEIDGRYERSFREAIGKSLRAPEPPPLGEPKPPAPLRPDGIPAGSAIAELTDMGATLSKLRAELSGERSLVASYRDQLGEKDHAIAELQREVGRLSLETRRAKR